MTLTEHLNNSIQLKRIDESILLSAIACTACIAYAAGPVLNTDFMKSVGGGLGALLGGIGSMFGSFNFGGSISKNKIKELLAKDPGDLTQNEKALINKAAADPKIKGELTDNELKKINKINGSSSTDDKSDDLDEDDAKELHAILKKKPEDMSPKEKERLKELHSKYDLSGELSDKELKSFEKATGTKLNSDDEGEDDDDDTNDKVTPEQISEAMAAMAAAANEKEEDEEKKKKNAALIDIITASTYDDDGNPLSMDKRLEKMKSLVGEDNWESFKADFDEMNKNLDEKKVEEELKKAKKQLNPDYIKELQDNQKKRAKEAAERIAKENKEREDLEKELEELKKDPEANKDKITELENKRETLINNSTMGIASPNTAKAAIKRAKGESGGEPVATPKEGSEEAKTAKKYDDKAKALQDEYTAKMEGKSEDEITQLQKEWDDKVAALTKERETEIEKAVEKDFKKQKDDLKAEYEQKKEGKTDEEKAALDDEYKNKKKEINDSQYNRLYKAKIEAKTAEFEERKTALEANYNAQIEAAKSDEDKERLREELKKEQKKLNNEKHKALDDIDDKEEYTDDDETKDGRYVVKTEEITDPDTGKKKTVKTFTGPRGGKFYYPDGKPKKRENKVYISESLFINNIKYLKLKRYLLESFNK